MYKILIVEDEIEFEWEMVSENAKLALYVVPGENGVKYYFEAIKQEFKIHCGVNLQWIFGCKVYFLVCISDAGKCYLIFDRQIDSQNGKVRYVFVFLFAQYLYCTEKLWDGKSVHVGVQFERIRISTKQCIRFAITNRICTVTDDLSAGDFGIDYVCVKSNWQYCAFHCMGNYCVSDSGGSGKSDICLFAKIHNVDVRN